ncbi:MAG: orotate phosphoribosyltransferase [Deltaproteobacteria bacterium]|nr:orotate phosphoribosyltransferase [Deltaproteobacteria bacterium]
MILGLEEIEKKVWEEEKLFLMKQVGILLIKNNAIKFGDYILSSGKRSPYYIDLRQTISSPITMDWIANSLNRIILNEIGKERIDKILGVPTAGVPFATVVSQKLGIPLIYYRQARKEHGVRKKIEGILDRNDRVLIVDDLITTGESVIEAAEVVREQGGVVNELVVLLDREQGGPENLRKARIEPHVLFKISDAMTWLHSVGLISKEIYETLKKYIEEESRAVKASST